MREGEGWGEAARQTRSTHASAVGATPRILLPVRPLTAIPHTTLCLSCLPPNPWRRRAGVVRGFVGIAPATPAAAAGAPLDVGAAGDGACCPSPPHRPIWRERALQRTPERHVRGWWWWWWWREASSEMLEITHCSCTTERRRRSRNQAVVAAPRCGGAGARRLQPPASASN